MALKTAPRFNSCHACGGPFGDQPRRADKRYCDAKCRARASRGRGEEPVRRATGVHWARERALIAKRAKRVALDWRAASIVKLAEGGAVAFTHEEWDMLVTRAARIEPGGPRRRSTDYSDLERWMRESKRPRYQDPETGEVRYWRRAFDGEPPGWQPTSVPLEPPVEMVYPTVAGTVKALTVEQMNALQGLGWRPAGEGLSLHDALLAPFGEPRGEPWRPTQREAG